MLRVPATTAQANNSTPFVVLTNPANPFGRLDSSDEIAVAIKADNPKKRAVIVWNDTLTLEGKNHGRTKLDHTDRKLEKYYVFAFDGKEAVCLNKNDAEGAYVMAQKIKEEAAQLGAASYAPYKEGENSDAEEEEAEAAGEKPAYKAKKQEFGSKKQLTREKRRLMGRISGAAVVGADELELETLVQDDEDGGDAAAAEGTARSAESFLPPYDEAATAVQDAYPSHGYFPLEERAHVHLVDRSGAFMSNFAKAQSAKLEKLNLLQGDAKQRKRHQDRDNLITYFELLLRLQMRMRGRFLASVEEGMRSLGMRGVSEELMAMLLARFMEVQPIQLGGGFAKTKTLSDKLCMHLLVIALAMEDFVLDKAAVQMIAGDLKLDPSALTPLFMRLGCKMGTERGESFFKLVVPLKFPVETRKRAKRRA